MREKSNFSPLKKNVTGVDCLKSKKGTKMTKREMYVAIVNGEMNEEMQALAAELIEGLDATYAKRKEKAGEKRAEKLAAEAELVNAIVEFLGDEFVTASDICEHFEEIATPQKATVLVKRAVEDGRVVTEKIKGAKGKVNGYKRA